MNNIDSRATAGQKEIRNIMPLLLSKNMKLSFPLLSNLFAHLKNLLMNPGNGVIFKIFPITVIRNVIIKFSLKTKLIISSLTFILILSVILVTYFIQIGKINLEKELEKWGTSLALNLAASSEYAILVNDNLALQNYLEGTMNQSEIHYSAILDRNGSILAKVDPKWLFTPIIQDQSTQKNDCYGYQIIDGKTYYNIVKPIKINEQDYLTDERIFFTKVSEFISRFNNIALKSESNNGSYILGFVVLGISIENTHHKLITMRNNAITITMIIVVFCVLFTFITADKMVAPIQQLVEATKKVAQQDLNHKIKSNRRDEIGVLATSFDEMITKLRESNETVKNYTQTLERRVSDQTKEMKESEKKYRTLFEHSGTAVAVLTDYNILSMVNKGFKDLSGYRKFEVEGKFDFFRFIHPDERIHIEEYLIKIRNNGQVEMPINHECQFIDREGRRKNVNLTMSLIPSTKNILVSIADVTKIRELQNKLTHAEQMAVIGRLSASIAHEIRNPLGAINTSVGILKSGLQLEEQDQELLNIISEESMRLNKIINDFLQFARPYQPKFKEVDINNLLNETLLLFKNEIGALIHKSIKYMPNLPLIQADPDKLKQVFINMIVNAIDAMPQGGILFIATRLIQNKILNNNWIEIIFKDTGQGIKQSDFERIFHPFYSTKEKGSGMGLAISHRIVQSHKGEIKVDSELNKGTKFTIVLPI